VAYRILVRKEDTSAVFADLDFSAVRTARGSLLAGETLRSNLSQSVRISKLDQRVRHYRLHNMFCNGHSGTIGGAQQTDALMIVKSENYVNVCQKRSQNFFDRLFEAMWHFFPITRTKSECNHKLPIISIQTRITGLNRSQKCKAGWPVQN
jgi:hypothetical protein